MGEYTGYEEVGLTDSQINSIMKDGKLYEEDDDGNDIPTDLGILENEYIDAYTEDGAKIDIFKRIEDGTFKRVPYITIKNDIIGNVKPRNTQQKMAMDLLYDPKTTVKVITGKFGTGKDYLMSSAAIDLINKNVFEKIVYVRNNVEVKNSKPIGFLPGSSENKLLPFAMPLADHIGGVDALSLLIDQGVIEVTHLGFIRGRDIKNSIIICSEAENMTKEHIQLLLGRVGEGSALWINGDFKQCDAEVFRLNNGLLTAINKLKGHPRFGYVKLIKTERSETAAMADLLD